MSDSSDDHPNGRPTAAQRRRHAQSYPLGMPILAQPDADQDDEDDVPSPWDAPTAPSRRDADAVNRAGRDPDEPVRPIELSALMRRLERRMNLRLVESQGAIAQAVESRIAPLERDFRPVRAFARWALGVAAGAIVAVIVFAYSRGAAEQHVTDELQTLREQTRELKIELAQLRNQNIKERP
ncbi:MAG TPA: hypothetical protein VFT22_07410 [Kofleriaceae bacterium]|nr:hypothetical protein [Kofleriaceae bacterium]